MAIQTISRIQNRRGLYTDLPSQLAEGELGWCLDTRQLFIGNSDGYGGNTEILTEYSANDQLINTVYSLNGANLTTTVPRKLQSKLNDIASIKDFGATGDGVTDDAPAINAAIAQLLQGYPTSGNIAVTLYFPAGTYLINSTILLYPYLSIKGAGANCTTILAASGTSMIYMMQTADSLGQTGANIGLNGATPPYKIHIADINISTNSQSMSAIQLVRYEHIRITNTYIVGGYTSGSTPGTDTAVSLLKIGSAVLTSDAEVLSCDISNFTYGIQAYDSIQYTTVNTTLIHNVYRGIEFGPVVNNNGPEYTSLIQSRFYAIDNYCIYVSNGSTSPGITSIGNTFQPNTNIPSIYWGTGTNLNTSLGDTFIYLPGIVNNGTQNLIVDAQQNNLAGGSGGLMSRTTSTVTTISIAAGASANVTAVGYVGYALYSITVSYGAWVTVYSSLAAESADASRPINTTPLPGSGVIAEIITTSSGTQYFSPAVIGYSSESSPNSNIQMKVYNNGVGSAAITVTLSLVQLEA